MSFSNINLFFPDCSFSLLRFWIFCSLRALAAPLSLVLSADAISLLHIPLPKSLMKILSNTRPCTDPCSAVLKPSFHFDNKQPIAFQYAFPAGLISYSISPRPYSPTLLLGTPYETVSKALLQSRCITSPASPLSETRRKIRLVWHDLFLTKPRLVRLLYTLCQCHALPWDLASKILSPLK